MEVMTSTDLPTRAFNVLETEYAKTKQLIELLEVEKKNLATMNEKLKDENMKLENENKKSKDENAVALARLNETMLNIEKQLISNFHKIELQIAIISTSMSCFRVASAGTLAPSPAVPPADMCKSCGHVHAPAPTAAMPAAAMPPAAVPTVPIVSAVPAVPIVSAAGVVP